MLTPACDTLIQGCTGPTANNYDSLATIDDGSCDFPCIDFEFSILTDCWPEEIGWELALDGGEVVASVSQGLTKLNKIRWCLSNASQRVLHLGD